MNKFSNTNKNTSWEKAASWYDELIESDKDTYQQKVILPNLLRLLEIKKGENILDLGCGQGFFAREFFRAGAKVTGVDLSAEMIALAKKKSSLEIKFEVASADQLSLLNSETFDKATIILALQNMENVSDVFQECQRILKPTGKLFIVLNHPTFRVPKESSWGWDIGDYCQSPYFALFHDFLFAERKKLSNIPDIRSLFSFGSLPKILKNHQKERLAIVPREKIQYRRIDRYLSESKVKIQTHPGDKPEDYTISFHRSLQFYFKLLQKNGFAVNRLEEWISHKKSQIGPRAKAEDLARKEIPLFMFLECVKKI